MGRRGPPKRPTQTLKLHGSKLAKDRADDWVPDAPAELAPPSSLTKSAAAIWRDMIPAMVRDGVVKEIDVPAFCRYCELRSRWWLLKRKADRAGWVGDKGLSQAAASLVKLEPLIQKLEVQFGLTPSARASLKLDQPSRTRSAAEAFFNDLSKRKKAK